MAEFTENYNLIKPSAEDYYDVQDFNENMDIIDGVMAAAETTMEEVGTKADDISNKIGNAEDTGETTVFGKLNSLASGGSSGTLTAIKSIQKVTVSLSTNQGSATKTINEVVPENCIVLMQHWQETTNLDTAMTYTLNATSIQVKTTTTIGGTITLHFQIIEFC